MQRVSAADIDTDPGLSDPGLCDSHSLFFIFCSIHTMVI